jgi:hypothetical protein
MLSHSCGPATRWIKKSAVYHQKLHKGLDFAMNVRPQYLHYFNSAVGRIPWHTDTRMAEIKARM